MRPMSDTHHHVQSSTGSIRSSQKIEDGFRKMKVNDGNGESDPYPDRPGERDCQFYLRTGLCGYGSSCRFNHPTNLPQVMFYNEELPERIGQPDCEYYLKTGACKYGSTCKYHHPKDRNGAEPVLFNVLNLPMRQGEKPCQYYLRTGTCRFGVACKFHHPQPDNGHSTAAYGMSTFPSPGLHHAGGLTMMSPYGTLPRPQLPQSYVPVMVSPSHGLLPPQGLAIYMGASNPMYGMKNQAYYPGSSPPMPMAVPVTLNGDLSERTEQEQQCRFFMNTGTCKYGDHCKYTHHGVRVSPPPPNFINPFVLPVRPGQPACGSFKTYGFCKLGPNCNFDHSVLPYRTGLPMPSPSLPSHYPSPVSSNYQRISPSPSRSGSKVMHNGKPDVKKKMSGTEKASDDSEQVQDHDS
ncbi:Zinc finger CCCH domain-containing protein 3 [Hirschfeldia incana]|nr:Zinc finger CCCH domain-containing protein 3 [Hirschfeldia incana]